MKTLRPAPNTINSLFEPDSDQYQYGVEAEPCLRGTLGGLGGIDWAEKHDLNGSWAGVYPNGEIPPPLPEKELALLKIKGKRCERDESIITKLEENYGDRHSVAFFQAHHKARNFEQHLSKKHFTATALKAAFRTFNENDWELLPMICALQAVNNKPALRIIRQAIKELQQEIGIDFKRAIRVIEVALEKITQYFKLTIITPIPEDIPLEDIPQLQPNAPSFLA
jgi:hypothetical protein